MMDRLPTEIQPDDDLALVGKNSFQEFTMSTVLVLDNPRSSVRQSAEFVAGIIFRNRENPMGRNGQLRVISDAGVLFPRLRCLARSIPDNEGK